MDIQSKDILEQILKRLDKIENQQHKLDRVMERLDTLQNILERQNQKQNLLDELLVKMAIKPELDKVVTTQLQGAQQESVQSFCVIDSKEDSTLFPHKATQPFQGVGNHTDDILKSIDDRTVDTAQKCRQLISWSQKIEEKLTDNNRENMKTFLAEIRSAKDLVKGQTNSELIWLNNQIDKKLSDIDSVVREIYQQQTGAKEEIASSAGQVVNMATVVKEVESTKASMINEHAAVNKHLDELTADLKSYIYQTKREIFAVTEKEAQIVRDQKQGSLLSQGKYTFDFYVNNFKTFVRSGKKLESLPWHINEMRTCVTGQVRMQENREMAVRLLYGRHPHEVGLQPRSDKIIKIKATICDINDEKLPPVCVGEEIGSLDEMSVEGNFDWGYQVGVISCDQLLQKGYGEKEGYLNEALLIRYEVEVL